jgi:hypothetical protein
MQDALLLFLQEVSGLSCHCYAKRAVCSVITGNCAALRTFSGELNSIKAMPTPRPGHTCFSKMSEIVSVMAAWWLCSWQLQLQAQTPAGNMPVADNPAGCISCCLGLWQPSV